jgi:hypothetical protein
MLSGGDGERGGVLRLSTLLKDNNYGILLRIKKGWVFIYNIQND